MGVQEWIMCEAQSEGESCEQLGGGGLDCAVSAPGAAVV